MAGTTSSTRALRFMGLASALACTIRSLAVSYTHLDVYKRQGAEWERRYRDCVADARISKRVVTVKELVRLILRSAVETGTPFAFNRDAVNRANPNSHKGVIYCSNLCTEIAQNMAPIETCLLYTSRCV